MTESLPPFALPPPWNLSFGQLLALKKRLAQWEGAAFARVVAAAAASLVGQLGSDPSAPVELEIKFRVAVGEDEWEPVVKSYAADGKPIERVHRGDAHAHKVNSMLAEALREGPLPSASDNDALAVLNAMLRGRRLGVLQPPWEMPVPEPAEKEAIHLPVGHDAAPWRAALLQLAFERILEAGPPGWAVSGYREATGDLHWVVYPLSSPPDTYALQERGPVAVAWAVDASEAGGVLLPKLRQLTEKVLEESQSVFDQLLDAWRVFDLPAPPYRAPDWNAEPIPVPLPAPIAPGWPTGEVARGMAPLASEQRAARVAHEWERAWSMPAPRRAAPRL